MRDLSYVFLLFRYASVMAVEVFSRLAGAVATVISILQQGVNDVF